MLHRRSTLALHTGMEVMSMSVRHSMQTDREVADHVQYVTPTNSKAGYHGDHRLREPPYLNLYILQATVYNNTLSD